MDAPEGWPDAGIVFVLRLYRRCSNSRDLLWTALILIQLRQRRDLSLLNPELHVLAVRFPYCIAALIDAALNADIQKVNLHNERRDLFVRRTCRFICVRVRDQS